MAFDFATAKAALRSELQSNFGVAAFYQDNSLIAPQPITVRYHFKKIDTYGDLVEAGYGKVVENIETIVLSPLDTPELTFVRDGRITLPSLPDVEFILRVLESAVHAQDQVWQVVRA